MRHSICAYTGIVGLLAFLAIGCAPIAGDGGSAAAEQFYNDHNYMGVFGYTAQPSYVNSGFGTYSLGYPIYTTHDINVVPEWVTVEKQNVNHYPVAVQPNGAILRAD